MRRTIFLGLLMWIARSIDPSAAVAQTPPAQNQPAPPQGQPPGYYQGQPPPGYYPPQGQPPPEYYQGQPPPGYYPPQGQPPPGYYQGQPGYQGQPPPNYYQGQPPGGYPPQGPPPPPPGYQWSQSYYGHEPYYGATPRGGLRGYLGFSGLFTGVLGQSGGPEYIGNGGGVSIWGGLRLSRLFALELQYTGTYHNPDTACVPGYFAYCFGSYLVLDLFGIDAKLHIPTQSSIDPFLQAGAYFGWIGREGYHGDGHGGGFDVGGGIDVWLTPIFTLGTRVLYRGVSLTDPAKRPGFDTFLSLLTAELTFGVHF